jgi:hypothetical protein
MTIKLFHSAAAALRRAGSLAKVAVRARSARPETIHGPCNAGNETPSGRYFGLLVHMDRLDR